MKLSNIDKDCKKLLNKEIFKTSLEKKKIQVSVKTNQLTIQQLELFCNRLNYYNKQGIIESLITPIIYIELFEYHLITCSFGTKHELEYLKGISDMFLEYNKGEDVKFNLIELYD